MHHHPPSTVRYKMTSLCCTMSSSKCVPTSCSLSLSYAVSPFTNSLTTPGSVAALKFPQMGNQMMVPRRERGNSPIPFGSERRRALDGVAKRKNMQERRKETAELEERGLWDWITDDVLGVSWNSYVSGYPSFGEGCPSVKAPFIRSPVSPPIS